MARILIDMDDSIVDMKGPWIERYNQDHGTNYTGDDMEEWDIVEKFGPCMYDYLQEEGFFINLKPYPYAIGVLERLSWSHELIIVTSSVLGHSMKEKGEWCAKHLPFLPPENFIIAKKKYLVNGDVLYDDGPHNIEEFPGITIAMRHPHNKDSDPDYWVTSLLQLEEIIDDLYGGE